MSLQCLLELVFQQPSEALEYVIVQMVVMDELPSYLNGVAVLVESNPC